MAIIDNPIVSGGGTVDQESALQWMLNNKTNYAGIAAGLTTLTTLPTFTQPAGVTDFTSAFKNDSNLSSVAQLSVSGNINCAEMFSGCTSLTTPPNIDSTCAVNNSTDNPFGSYRMFYNCSRLQNISLPVRFFRNAYDTRYTFSNCGLLKTFNSTNTLNSLGFAVEARYMFASCSALETITLDGRFGPSSSSGRINCAYMFAGCSSLKTITTGSSFNPSRISSGSSMFYNCSRLEDLPAMSLPNITNMLDMFRSCSRLTNNSLDNILSTLLSATSYNGTKTLENVGLSSTQATTCTTLSNWAALSAAGWTTGY